MVHAVAKRLYKSNADFIGLVNAQIYRLLSDRDDVVLSDTDETTIK